MSDFHLDTVGTHEDGLAWSLAEDKGEINECDRERAFHPKLSVILRHTLSSALPGVLLEDLLPVCHHLSVAFTSDIDPSRPGVRL